MALWIAAGIKTPAVILIFDLHDDLGTGCFGARIIRIGILDDDVGALGPDTRGIPRRRDPSAEFVLSRAERLAPGHRRVPSSRRMNFSGGTRSRSPARRPTEAAA